jgi:hypothetical protein
MTATPSRIHSHRSEEPDSPAAGDGEASAEAGVDGSGDGAGDSVDGDGDGAGGGAAAGVVFVGEAAEVGAAEGSEDCVSGGSVGVSAEALSDGAAEGLGERVLDGTVGGVTVGGVTVGSETVGSEAVGDGRPMLPVGDTLGRAFLIPPLTQPAARYPAARIATAAPSVLVIDDLFPSRAQNAGSRSIGQVGP